MWTNPQALESCPEADDLNEGLESRPDVKQRHVKVRGGEVRIDEDDLQDSVLSICPTRKQSRRRVDSRIMCLHCTEAPCSCTVIKLQHSLETLKEKFQFVNMQNRAMWVELLSLRIWKTHHRSYYKSVRCKVIRCQSFILRNTRRAISCSSLR